MDDSKVVGGKVKKPGKRGRKPAKIDLKAKLERSRQSARECRARKKLRYQYLEELVSSRERAICALREELEMLLPHLPPTMNHLTRAVWTLSLVPERESLEFPEVLFVI
nr:cAMP-responsive element-binding protein-like 2 isoform X2 [Loxodonta africana]